MSVLSEVTTRISCGRASSRTSRTISSSAELAAALGAWATMIDDVWIGGDGGRLNTTIGGRRCELVHVVPQ